MLFRITLSPIKSPRFPISILVLPFVNLEAARAFAEALKSAFAQPLAVDVARSMRDFEDDDG